MPFWLIKRGNQGSRRLLKSMSQTAIEATPAHLSCRLRLRRRADDGQSRLGANPSLTNSQDQTPNTLLLNAHQMSQNTAQATRRRHHTDSHSSTAHSALPASAPASTTPPTHPDTPDRGGAGTRTAQSRRAPGSPAKEPEARVAAGAGSLRGSTRRLGAMLAFPGGRSA